MYNPNNILKMYDNKDTQKHADNTVKTLFNRKFPHWQLYKHRCTHNTHEYTHPNPQTHTHRQTCASFADHHTQVDGSPFRLGSLAVGTETVARLRPDPICHLAIRQRLTYRIPHGVHPLLSQLLGLCDETAERDERTAECQRWHDGVDTNG